MSGPFSQPWSHLKSFNLNAFPFDAFLLQPLLLKAFQLQTLSFQPFPFQSFGFKPFPFQSLSFQALQFPALLQFRFLIGTAFTLNSFPFLLMRKTNWWVIFAFWQLLNQEAYFPIAIRFSLNTFIFTGLNNNNSMVIWIKKAQSRKSRESKIGKA